MFDASNRTFAFQYGSRAEWAITLPANSAAGATDALAGREAVRSGGGVHKRWKDAVPAGISKPEWQGEQLPDGTKRLPV